MMDLHRAAFREEAFETLTLLESALLELEEEPADVELIGCVFRYLHTIKGSGAMFGYDEVASFTHEVETVFDLVRGGSIPVSKELIDLTLAARDRIRMLLEGSDGPAAQEETAALIQAFRSLLPAGGAEQREPDAAGTSEVSTPRHEQAQPQAYRIRFTPDPEIFLSGVNPLHLLNELRSLGKLTVTVDTDGIPTLEEANPELCCTSWNMVLVSTCTLDDIEDVFIFVDGSRELTIEKLDLDSEEGVPYLGQMLLARGEIDAEKLQDVLDSRKKIGELLVESGLVSRHSVQSALVEQQHLREMQKERSVQEKTSSIRVPSERLDHLVNLVGEQVTVQARLSQLAHALKNPELAAICEEVARLTVDLRESTLKIRMLPIGATFNSFKRLVRDLSVELGKEIELTTSGEETELDKTVIEKLNDPLVHLIRNSVDHAIELPSDRLAKGKPSAGKIRLCAEHSGDSVYISITDDGSGLDTARILAKGIERGLVPAGAELSEREIFALIFAPGFSTAKTVTGISGRGVGMDVVKRSIEELRGTIDIRSERDKGTTMTIRIPLTLAIIECLLVKIASEHYLIPLQLVDECMFLTRQDLDRAHGRQVVNVRDRIVPYIRLRDRFQIPPPVPAIEQLVITELNGERIGLVVDSIIGQHQTVIKALGTAYKNVEWVSGATILGDGSVALILDIPKLYRAEELDAQAA